VVVAESTGPLVSHPFIFLTHAAAALSTQQQVYRAGWRPSSTRASTR